MKTFDIIPDIHGRSEKLQKALGRLGWQRKPSGWLHVQPDREIVFLGDFIDRGRANRAVLETVRSLMDSGKARAVMGNHELNALHFHTLDPATGTPLRPHSAKNIRQHESFLTEFPLGAPQTRDVLAWMARLPLFLEERAFRAVHACWDEVTIGRLRELTADGVLSEQQLLDAASPGSGNELAELVERTTKGPECALPPGFSISDKEGTVRREVRLQWWNTNARTWREIATSVPDLGELPDAELPKDVQTRTYPVDGKPVFFGHYWLTGEPELQAANALCLDYSAGKGGPLVTYTGSFEDCGISLEQVVVH